MSTRGIIAIRSGKRNLTMYNHFDSYPSDLGVRLLEDLRSISSELTLRQIKNHVKNIQCVDALDMPPKTLVKRYKNYLNELGNENWYWLLRNLQGEILPYLKGEVLHMVDGDAHWPGIYSRSDKEFLYIINLNSCRFYTYKLPMRKNNWKHNLILKCRLINLPTAAAYMDQVNEASERLDFTP